MSYREELCNVSTTDYQTFTVTVKEWQYRKDGTEFSLNDIYFTYNTLLKQNYRNIWHLDTYKNLLVDVDWNTLQVVFPKASVDNMLFFTNFILPAHLLANKSLETYVETFVKRPIWTSCATIIPSENDPDSIVFDLETCWETLLRYYQVKQFDSQEAIDSYVIENPQTIDLVFTDHSLEGYIENRVILNRYITLFFNSERSTIPTSLRKSIISLMQKNLWKEPYSSVIIEDPYVFESFGESSQLSIDTFSWLSLTNPVDQPTVQTIPELTETLTRWSENNQSKEYLLPDPIADKFSLFMKFQDEFDKVSVSFNEGVEYFPESFNATSQSTYYNLNPIYRNIAIWRNTYTIKWYINWIHEKTYTLVVHYQSEPTYPTQEIVAEAPEHHKLQFIYFDNPTNNKIVEWLQRQLQQAWVANYFIFESYDDPNAFEWKLTSKDYDIVLRAISMWLRKDLSTLFSSVEPTINPSLYQNDELIEQINTYFLWNNEKRQRAKQRIDEIYEADIPLFILGKELGSVNIKSNLDFTYPFRLYVLWWRKDFINQIRIFEHVSIDWDTVLNTNNMVSFVLDQVK